MSKPYYTRSKEIVTALQNYHQWNRGKSAYEDIVTEYLIEFFQKLNWPTEEKYPDVCDIGAYRDRLLLRAIIWFEDSPLEWVATYRKRYLAFAKNHTACKTGIHAEDCSIDAGLLRNTFERIMKSSMPERQTDYNIIHGAWAAITIYFAEFIEKVYLGQNMYETIQNSMIRGIGGTFGQTKLLTWDCAGRLVMTFSRDGQSITFIQESDDPLALGAGVQSCSATLANAIEMIEDVIANYNPDDFKEDSTITMV